MPRRLTVASHLPTDALERRYRVCRDPVERSHWHMVWLVAVGHRAPEVATLTGYSVKWVRTIIGRYNADGPTGLTDRRHANPGQPPLLTPALREELRQALMTAPPDGGLWTGRQVAAWMAERLDRPVGEVRGWETMRALGFTPQRPRRRETRVDPAAQDAFKKGGSAMPSRASGPPIPRRP